MSYAQIQCQNCGKNYKIPTTFTGASAKCKACGTSIDVQSQLNAKPEAKPEEPVRKARAEAKPAETARTRRAARAESDSGSKSKATGSKRRGRRGKGADLWLDEDGKGKRASRRKAAAAGRRGRRDVEVDDEEMEEVGGRGRGRGRRKDNTMMVGGIAAGVLAVVATILVWVLWDDLSGKIDDAKNTNNKVAKEDSDIMEKARREKAEREKKALADKEAKEAADKKAADKKAKEAAAKKKGPSIAKGIPVEVKTLEDAYKPKDKLKPLPLTESMDAAKQKEIEGLLMTVVTEKAGLPSIRAREALKEHGFAALVPIYNELIKLDYTTQEGTDTAMPILSVVEQITGWDPNFAPAAIGEKIEPQMAHNNGLAVRELNQMLRQSWKTEADMRKWKRKNSK